MVVGNNINRSKNVWINVLSKHNCDNGSGIIELYAKDGTVIYFHEEENMHLNNF